MVAQPRRGTFLRRFRPGTEAAVLRAARRRDPEVWAALRDGFGEGTAEQRCLLTPEIPDVVVSASVVHVPVSALAGPVEPRGYDELRARYTCRARRVDRVHGVAPVDRAAVVHLHVDQKRRLRLSVMPCSGGPGDGFGCTADQQDVRMVEEWLR